LNRREFLKATGGAALGLFFLRNAAFSNVSGKPNIVFILTDDHRYDALGFMNKPWLKTPSMDRLAGEGVQFTNSFVTTSLCSPSRASFLTGQYASRHGVRDTHTPLPDDSVTFLEVLRAAGYHTGFIGKWHMSGKGIPDLVARGKADRMVSFSVNFGQGAYFDCPLIIDGMEKHQEGYITDVLSDYALEFLDDRGNKPFCLYLSHKAVHDDFRPPERYRGKLDDAPLPQREAAPFDRYPVAPSQEILLDNFERNQQGYYEALMAVDDSVGRVLDYLDEKGLAENTLVVYAGDNGFLWGEHGLIDKRYAYEESIRIPHLLRWPGLIPEGGKKVAEMVLNIDLLPTILHAAGIKTPGGVQGKSYLALCAGNNTPWRKSWLYEYFGDFGFPQPPIRAVRTEDWKLITYKKSYMQTRKFQDEMYHLAEDPGERNNLIDDPARADKRKELLRELKRLMKEAT